MLLHLYNITDINGTISEKIGYFYLVTLDAGHQRHRVEIMQVLQKLLRLRRQQRGLGREPTPTPRYQRPRPYYWARWREGRDGTTRTRTAWGRLSDPAAVKREVLERESGALFLVVTVTIQYNMKIVTPI